VSIVALVSGEALRPWLDTTLFNAIHPAVRPGPSMLVVSKAFAVVPLFLSYAVLLLVLLVTRAKGILVEAVAALSLALVFNWFLGRVWYQPRPFLTPGVQAWVHHAATSSFPSDHLTIHWCIAGVLIGHRRTRVIGVAVALLGLPMAWGRIYLGVHYPGDMLGAALVAACFASVAVFIGRKSASWLRLGARDS